MAEGALCRNRLQNITRSPGTALLVWPTDSAIMNAVQNVEAPLDLHALDSLRDSLDGDVEALIDVVGSYLEDVPQQLAEMQRCIEQSDLPALARAAHTLKGTSQAFGARALVAACVQFTAPRLLRGDVGDLLGVLLQVEPTCPFSNWIDATH